MAVKSAWLMVLLVVIQHMRIKSIILVHMYVWPVLGPNYPKRLTATLPSVLQTVAHMYVSEYYITPNTA